MTPSALPLSVYVHFASAMAFGWLFAWLATRRDGQAAPPAASRALLAAVAASTAWSLAAAVDPLSSRAATAYLMGALDVVRYGAWFALLLILLSPGDGAPPPLWRVASLAVAVGLALVAWRASAGLYEPDGSRLWLVAMLGLSLVGLVLIEQFFRNLPEDSRWNAKPITLGLGLGFAFDLYLHAEAFLLGRLDPDALAVRGIVQAMAVPLIYLSSRRRADWIRRLQISRSAAFYSTTLLLAGGYLLFMSAVGYYVRFFGGDWGRALQIALLMAALALLGLLALSGSLRARVRVFVGKHFFSYRFDYREQWLRFTAMLSTRGSPQEVGTLVIRGLADMVESPGGSLWTRLGPEPAIVQGARWNMAAVNEREPADSEFCRFLQSKGWVIDLDEYRDAPRRYGQLALPAWLAASPNAWLVVPLQVGDELLGFVVLCRPRAPLELDWEVRDLLKTAARQAAGFLAQMHAAEALLEARKFDAFNRMSAFVVHDLKNIVTQLSLMLKNAQRHHDNPEFQADMLLTVESSLEKMRRLMLQLREGATPPGSALGVELAPLARRLAESARSTGRMLEVECAEGLATRGHDERLERVLGHLVQNALDATPASGRVWLKAARHSGQVRIEIGDTGAGMSEEFVQNRLFRPFASTKASGMGIGSYESAQYIRELGGSIEVASAPGRGTVMTLTLPLFEARSASDLQAAA